MQTVLRLAAAYLTPLHLLRGWSRASRLLCQLAEEAAPVIRITADKLPEVSMADGVRIHLEGGVCHDVVSLSHLCRLTGNGTVKNIRITKRSGRLSASGITLHHIMISRGVLRLTQCQINCSLSHGVVGNRSSICLEDCSICSSRGSYYNGVFARRCEVRLHKCEFLHCFAGASLEDCTSATISHTAIRKCREGIVLQRCHLAQVSQCRIHHTSLGLQLIQCLQAVVGRSEIETSVSCTALLCQGNGAPLVRCCTLTGKVVILDASRVVLRHNAIHQGMRISRSDPVIIDNRISGHVTCDLFAGVLAHNHMNGTLEMRTPLSNCSCYNNITNCCDTINTDDRFSIVGHRSHGGFDEIALAGDKGDSRTAGSEGGQTGRNAAGAEGRGFGPDSD